MRKANIRHADARIIYLLVEKLRQYHKYLYDIADYERRGAEAIAWAIKLSHRATRQAAFIGPSLPRHRAAKEAAYQYWYFIYRQDILLEYASGPKMIFYFIILVRIVASARDDAFYCATYARYTCWRKKALSEIASVKEVLKFEAPLFRNALIMVTISRCSRW